MVARPFYRIVVGAVVGAFLFLYLTPTVYSILLSFDVLAVPRVSDSPNLNWYKEIFSDDRLLGALSRSFWIASSASLLAVTACVLAFSDFHRYSSTFKKVLLSLVMLPLFVPETTHALTLSDALSRMGWLSGWGRVLIGEIVYILPFVAIVVLLRVASISPNIGNAARDLGMGSFKRAIHVTFPLVWLAAVSAFVFGFLLAFNENARAGYFQTGEMYSIYLRGNLSGGGGQSVYAVSASMFILGALVLWILERSSRHWGQDD